MAVTEGFAKVVNGQLYMLMQATHASFTKASILARFDMNDLTNTSMADSIDSTQNGAPNSY